MSQHKHKLYVSARHSMRASAINWTFCWDSTMALMSHQKSLEYTIQGDTKKIKRKM